MSDYRILVVEDDKKINKFLTAVLEANDYDVLSAEDGKGALRLLTSAAPDMMLLDLGLPDTDGAKLIASVRGWSNMPIIVVSARERSRDKVDALDLGADDYMTKPIDPAELLARIRNARRHGTGGPAQEETGVFSTGGFVLDMDRRRASVDGREVHFTQNEYRIVALLCKFAGKVLTHDAIIKAVWGPNYLSDNQILRVNMANIRRKIEKNPAEPRYILTEVGVGYRMAEPD